MLHSRQQRLSLFGLLLALSLVHVSPPAQAGVGPGGIDAVGVAVVLKKPKPPKPPKPPKTATTAEAATATTARAAAPATPAATAAPAAGRPYPYRDRCARPGDRWPARHLYPHDPEQRS